MEMRRGGWPAAVWVAVAVVVAVLCCCGGGVLALIAPDELAAFSPFNW